MNNVNDMSRVTITYIIVIRLNLATYVRINTFNIVYSVRKPACNENLVNLID